ncbi:putative coiled-coil domain-containing protein 96 [Trypanosoma rangeli]|uniref:Putative coiled-coil domain-containing protein 96 n=1 Tax=Trypanosoma rangeli TaxID=5698 RepID=A0A422NXD4_TRYRA|nr:putative coiled-coil domain-containing protein 96 [Trypanosoma rangeli]RNF10091.1 putative coiled-coil domain-containing protein 96 [Trypanosoma rangeli]|eukprot:RNF10091.1 putative coiled-coil domain-containing protein 96 [Trypanosoma rangeli]
MYEYDDQQFKEEALRVKAAEVIQKRWKEYAARREAEAETWRDKAVHLGAAAAAAAAAVVAAKEEEPTAAVSVTEEPQRLLAEYTRLVEQRKAVVERSLSCQRQLARHFALQRQRKGEERPQAVSPEAEQQYWLAVRQMRDEQQVVQSQKDAAGALLSEIKQQHQSTIDAALAQEEEFREYIKQLAQESVFVRTHRQLTAEEIAAFLERDKDQRFKIRNARIRHLLLCHDLEKLQRAAAQRDLQQDGMNLIDFEQLKIENTNLNEKIEERNEDLLKLRRKVTTTIHVLTHVKEKLEFMKVENIQLRRQVSTTEEELNELRDKLAQTKRRRDHFATSNIKMREKMPMVGSEKLLLDYERRKAACKAMRQDVLDNAAKHKELLAAIDRNQVVLNGLQKTLALGNPANVGVAQLRAMT